MTVTLTPGERAAFKRCRRAWDFGARNRRNLEPVSAGALDADRVVRDALAVYYFPGMWDWPRGVVLPLVNQALDKALDRRREGLSYGLGRGFEAEPAALRRLLGGYLEWAPGIERLAPVLVEVDYEVDLVDPDRPDVALRTPSGDNVRYRGRADLIALDEHDAYWIVRHRVVDCWTPLEVLARDEEAVAACWAWEQFYLGMSIAGTIHNELRVPADFEAGTLPGTVPGAGGPKAKASDQDRRGLPQSEGSGGGRSIPQHRRLYARSSEPEEPDRVVRDIGPWFRRTWIRRAASEIDQAGRQLANEARHMLGANVDVGPSPSELACPHCLFAEPCRVSYEGGDAEAALANGYRSREPDELVEGRLGGMTWGTGRGAAPPRF
jgi:hypothetical protein